MKFLLLVTANNAEAIKNNEKLKALMTCLQNIMIKSFKISKTIPSFQMTKLNRMEETCPTISSFAPGLSNPQPKHLSLSRAIYSISNYSRETFNDLWNSTAMALCPLGETSGVGLSWLIIFCLILEQCTLHQKLLIHSLSFDKFTTS